MKTVFTYGYTGRDPGELLSLAQKLDALVIDIRERAQSRDARWNARALRASLGTRYRHVQALGNLNYKNGGPIRFRDAEGGLEALETMLADGSVILMCACRSPMKCHRTVAAKLLALRLDMAVADLS